MHNPTNENAEIDTVDKAQSIFLSLFAFFSYGGIMYAVMHDHPNTGVVVSSVIGMSAFAGIGMAIFIRTINKIDNTEGRDES